MAAAFITEVDLETFTGGTVDSAQAALAIDIACAVCRTTAEQTFTQETDDVVVLDGTGSDSLLLPQLPVTEVSAVVENDTAVDSDDYRLTAGGLLVKPRGWWRTGRQNITVTYSHGYPDGEIPADVRMVALSVASRLLLNGGSGGAVQQETLGAYSVTYAVAQDASTATDLTDGERAVLRKYRPT